MRFGRLSTTDDDEGGRKGLPMLLPMMKRNRQSAREAKENVPPKVQNDHGEAMPSTKASRRRTVIDFFKHKGEPRAEAENEAILTRMTTQRTKSVGLNFGVSRFHCQPADWSPQSKSKHGRNSSSYGLNETSLDRILGPSKEQEQRKATDNFFLQQQVRTDSRNASGSHHIPPFTTGNKPEPDRPLREEEIFVMFEGAPCFSVVDGKSGHRPDVVFHGGSESAGHLPTYLPDFVPLKHETFTTCTLGVHEIKESEDIPFASHLRIRSQGTDDEATLLEVPSMCSANGREPGTVGFEYFLQLPIADSLAASDETATFENRSLLLSDPTELGLLPYDLTTLVNRLNTASEHYETLMNDETKALVFAKSFAPELGESVFGSLLSTNHISTPIDENGTFSLNGQINALQRILEMKGIWHDFRLVEWRIRIGQLLWTETIPDEADGFTNQPSEKDVLILQVTLAAELLLRLKIVQILNKGNPTSGIIDVTERRSRKVQWDLVLAKRFLTNLKIFALPDTENEEKGVRNSFFSAISFLTSDGSQDVSTTKPILQPKNEDKQISGLMLFAQTLEWPHTEDVLAQLRPPPDTEGNERPVSMASMYATPLDSPGLFTMESAPGTRLSYFGAMNSQRQQSRPGMSRTHTAQSIQLRPASNEVDGFNVGGWLSRSWLSGLVMPGESSSHFLISTLLENSPKAIKVLGDNADLYGGFVYGDRTFWSKSSVVGRVLAAGSGAADCMGWISCQGVPPGHPEGWVDAKVSEFPYPSTRPRIVVHGAVARASDPFHNTPATQLRAGDFALPTDSPPVMGNEVLSHGLTFSNQDTTTDSSDSKATAHLTFSSPINPKLPHITVPLTYDVHFVSSYPCYPVPTKSNNNDNNLGPNGSPYDNALALYTSYTLDTPPPPAHPLHTSYRFMTLPVATLLSAGAEEARSRALSLPDQQAEDAIGDEDEEVTVLDCRGHADLELLARAWCAKVGENAVVGRVGRTCLACCIREARGLGVRVVIRT
jgi:hypothetical protein